MSAGCSISTLTRMLLPKRAKRRKFGFSGVTPLKIYIILYYGVRYAQVEEALRIDH